MSCKRLVSAPGTLDDARGALDDARSRRQPWRLRLIVLVAGLFVVATLVHQQDLLLGARGSQKEQPMSQQMLALRAREMADKIDEFLVGMQRSISDVREDLAALRVKDDGLASTNEDAMEKPFSFSHGRATENATVVYDNLRKIKGHVEHFSRKIDDLNPNHYELFSNQMKGLESVLVSLNSSKFELECSGKTRKENPHNIAVCAYGSFRVNNLTVPNFRRFVYNYLAHPDVFLYVKPLDQADMIPHQQEFLKMVHRSVVVEDVNYTLIREKGGYSPCLDGNEPAIDRNWNHGWPASTNPRGSVVHQYRGAEQCGVIIKEEEKKRGRKYDRVVFTRTDHTYLGPHPLMEELPEDKVSIPAGEDWRGINDRHSVFPRDLIEPRIRIHEELMTGKYNCSFRQRGEQINGEIFMKLFYEDRGIGIHRYDARTYLGCSEIRHRYIDDPARCWRYGTEFDLARNNEKEYGWSWTIAEFVQRVRNAKDNCIYY